MYGGVGRQEVRKSEDKDREEKMVKFDDGTKNKRKGRENADSPVRAARQRKGTKGKPEMLFDLGERGERKVTAEKQRGTTARIYLNKAKNGHKKR